MQASLRRWSLLLLSVTPFAAASCAAPPTRPAGSSAVPVTAASVKTADFPIELRAVGSVESPWSVDVRAQVDGPVEAVHFREGQDVAKGDLLFTIDRRPYEAALAAAEATLAKDRAQAQSAEADRKRAADLFAQGVIAVDVNDRAQAAARALAATVDADQAAVQTARLRLDYCSIRSPLAGRTGATLVKPGNLVRALDSTALVSVQQIDPVDIRFSVPEARLAEIRRGGALPVEANVRDEGSRPHRGALSFIDNQVDRSTGTVKLKARFANADRSLWPGQFVDVNLLLSTRKGAVVIPSPAVQDGQKGPFVFVVKGDGTADVRPVAIGPARGGETLVESGLAAGETVVVDGQVRLSPGARVEVRPAGKAQ